MPDFLTVEEILREMRSLANPAVRAGLARFGVQDESVIGLSVPQLRSLARRSGHSQPLAEKLWATGIHDARILASLVGEPSRISEATMDQWAREAGFWDVCDACCCNLFDRTPHVWKKIRQWAGDDHEFVRRAGFATLAAVAVHDKGAKDELFLKALQLVEKHAYDDRNFARKAVSWALRNIGKRNAALRPAALSCAERLLTQDTRSSRWIAADAIRELKRR